MGLSIYLDANQIQMFANRFSCSIPGEFKNEWFKFKS